jgi:Flp pilus assembly protein CpaB
VKRSNRLVILVGVLLAVLAFVAIVILLNRPDGGGEGGDGSPEAPRATVLVATQAIAIGDPITPDIVEAREVDPEAVQGTAMSDTSQVAGQPAIFAIPEGAQVPLEAVRGGDTVNIADLLEPGEKAVAVRVDEQTGVGFLVQPGNIIDIVVAAEVSVLQETADSISNTDPNAPPRFEEVPGLEAARTVKAVLQNKRVLYVSATRAEEPEPQDTNGDGVIDENDDPPAAQTIESVIIVFAGTDQDAEVIKFAQRDRSELSSERNEIASSITVTVRHDDDEEIEPTTGVTIDSLVEEFGLRIPGIVDQLAPDESPAP